MPGSAIARIMVVGTMRIPTAIQDGLAMVRAASMPMWNLLPSKRLLSTSLTPSAKGSRPSIRICIILGVITIAVAVDIATIRHLSTGSPARMAISSPITVPTAMGSPSTPKRF